MLFVPFWTDHRGLESGMVFKGTTRAYKRMENGMFWSETGSGFKEPGGTPQREFRGSPRTEAHRVQSCPFSNILFDMHARIDEIKTTTSMSPRLSYLLFKVSTAISEKITNGFPVLNDKEFHEVQNIL